MRFTEHHRQQQLLLHAFLVRDLLAFALALSSSGGGRAVGGDTTAYVGFVGGGHSWSASVGVDRQASSSLPAAAQAGDARCMCWVLSRQAHGSALLSSLDSVMIANVRLDQQP